MAEPLAGGELLDPHGGRADLGARRLRTVGPSALDDDPLRALRAVRLAIDLDLTIAPETAAAMSRAAPGLERVAAERIFGELKQVIASPSVRTGLTLMDAHGLTAQVLPELVALRGVEQNEFHHLDVHDHTLAVLDEVVAIEHDPLAAGFGGARGGGRRAAARAARRRAHARPGDAVRRAAARRGQAVDADDARRRARRRVPGPRPRGRGARPRRAAPAARLGASSPTTSPRSACTTCGSASSSTSGRSDRARSGATSRPPNRGRPR